MIFSLVAIFNSMSDTIPGTVHLVDIIGNLTAKKDGDVILSPQPSENPLDPLRWSQKKKNFQFTILWIWSFVLAAILNFNGPLFGILVGEQGWTGMQINIGVALGFIGLGTGVALHQPLATKIGKRGIYLYCTILGVVACAVGSKGTFVTWYVYRTLAGLAASPVDALVEFSACDIYFKHQRASKFSLLVLALYLGSYLPPVLSGLIADNIGWRWNYYILMILCVVTFVGCTFLLEDSSFKREFNGDDFENNIIEQIRSHNSGEISSTDKNGNLIETIELNSEKISKTYRQKMRVIEKKLDDRSYFEIFMKPFLIFYFPAIIWGAFIYGLQMCWLSLIALTQLVYFGSAPYNFSNANVGLTNLGSCFGCIFGMFYGGPFVDWLAIKLAKRNNGIYEPEFKLYAMIVPTILNGAGILAYGLGLNAGVNWGIPVVLGIGLMGFASGSTGSIVLSYAYDCYEKLGPEALVVILVIRNAVGAGFSFGLEPWLAADGLVRTTWFMFLISMVFNGGFIFFILYGKKFRKWTAPRFDHLSDPNYSTIKK